MMNRRSFLGRITKALAGAALAANLELGRLAPVPEAEILWPPPLPPAVLDYYVIEWPMITRQWTFGTYASETFLHGVSGDIR